MRNYADIKNEISYEIIFDEIDPGVINLGVENDENPDYSFEDLAVEKSISNSEIISDLANYLATKYITDNGEIVGLLHQLDRFINWLARGGVDNKCTPRRVKDLARAWRAVIEASGSGDVNKILKAAKRFRYHAKGRSSMFNRCYKHMKKRHSDLAEIADIALKIAVLG